MRVAKKPRCVFTEQINILMLIEIPKACTRALGDGERKGRVMEHRPGVAARHYLQRFCEAFGASRVRRSETLLCIPERFSQRNIEQVEVNHGALPLRSIRAHRDRWRASMALEYADEEPSDEPFPFLRREGALLTG